MLVGTGFFGCRRAGMVDDIRVASRPVDGHGHRLPAGLDGRTLAPAHDIGRYARSGHDRVRCTVVGWFECRIDVDDGYVVVPTTTDDEVPAMFHARPLRSYLAFGQEGGASPYGKDHILNSQRKEGTPAPATSGHSLLVRGGWPRLAGAKRDAALEAPAAGRSTHTGRRSDAARQRSGTRSRRRRPVFDAGPRELRAGARAGRG